MLLEKVRVFFFVTMGKYWDKLGTLALVGQPIKGKGQLWIQLCFLL